MTHRAVLNKRKGSQFERTISKMFAENFPDFKFQRSPNSRNFDFTNTLGDIIVPEEFPHRQIECRLRKFDQAHDLRKFFEDFEKSDFGKWFYECQEKFAGDRWIIIFKIGRGDIYIIVEEKLKINKYIYNEICYCYKLEDYMKWIKDYVRPKTKKSSLKKKNNRI